MDLKEYNLRFEISNEYLKEYTEFQEALSKNSINRLFINFEYYQTPPEQKLLLNFIHYTFQRTVIFLILVG